MRVGEEKGYLTMHIRTQHPCTGIHSNIHTQQASAHTSGHMQAQSTLAYLRLVRNIGQIRIGERRSWAPTAVAIRIALRVDMLVNPQKLCEKQTLVISAALEHSVEIVL